MDGENPLPLWLRHALIGVGLFLAGAILAFGYSYRPLHGALSWEVDQLQVRLDERNRENLQLTDALAKHKNSEAKRIDPATFAQVERELDQTKRVLRQAEKDLKRAERKRKESGASAAKWRKQFEELRDRGPALANVTPSDAEADRTDARPGFEMNPASPAAVDSSGSDFESRGAPERGILGTDGTTEPTTP